VSHDRSATADHHNPGRGDAAAGPQANPNWLPQEERDRRESRDKPESAESSTAVGPEVDRTPPADHRTSTGRRNPFGGDLSDTFKIQPTVDPAAGDDAPTAVDRAPRPEADHRSPDRTDDRRSDGAGDRRPPRSDERRPDYGDRGSDRGSERSGDRQEWPEQRLRREAPTGSRIRPEDAGENWPELPDWADPVELGPDVLRDLRGLSKENSEFVGRHLVAATELADDEPELAWRHARAARSKGGRIAVVRETVGLVAYRAEEWAEAISELRAARRMGGGPGHVAILADCERALGNPEKALDLARSPEAALLDPSAAAELRIVAAGARADLGQLDAALALLEQGDGFQLENPEPYSARLYYAYADLLLTAGRAAEALEWFVRADDSDDEGDTDADERIAELMGDADGDDDDDELMDEDDVDDEDDADDDADDDSEIDDDDDTSDHAAEDAVDAEFDDEDAARATDDGPADKGANDDVLNTDSVRDLDGTDLAGGATAPVSPDENPGAEVTTETDHPSSPRPASFGPEFSNRPGQDS
jgi:tetratricopeptide (TPR) repeat protein